MAETKTRINNLDQAQSIADGDILYIKKAVPESGRSADQQAAMSQVKSYVYPPEANLQTTGLINTSPQAFSGKKTFQNGLATSTIETSGSATFGADASVVGDLHVSGNIIQQGHSYETEVETLAVKDEIIKTRDGATTGMASGEFTGLQAEKYDGTYDGRLVFGADGIARVGDYTPADGDDPAVDDTQPLATREETPTDGAVLVWDDTNNRLKSLSKGTAGQVLTSNGPDADPEMKPLSGAVLAAHVEGTCSSAADAEYKDVYLTDYADTLLPAEMTVQFSNKNTFGDTTASTPTYPKLRIYNSNNVLIATNNVCDSRGHVAGEGCWNDGDDMDFKNQNGKSRITNSDIRQANSNMTIKSDGKIEIIGYPETETPTGRKWLDGKPTYVRVFSFTRKHIDESAINLVPNDFNCSKVVRGFVTDDTNRESFGVRIRATNTYIQSYVDYHSCYANHLYIEYTKTTD